MKQYRIKDMYQTDEEKIAGEVFYKLIEDRGDRVLIAPIVWTLGIVPTELVSKELIEEVR
jgi:hypothetical protein